MSVEESLIVRLPKDRASSQEDAKEVTETLLRGCHGITIANLKLKKMQESLQTDDKVIEILNVEEAEDHYKVAANYLESFYLDMKGTDSTISKRAEDIISKNASVFYGAGSEVSVLMTTYNCLTASELENEDIQLDMV